MSGILAIQALVSFAIIKYFMTTAKADAHPLKTLVAPLVGGIAQIYAVYLLISNRETLAGSTVPFIEYLPWIVLAIFVAGLLLALYYRSSDQKRYEAIGRYMHEDAIALLAERHAQNGRRAAMRPAARPSDRSAAPST